MKRKSLRNLILGTVCWFLFASPLSEKEDSYTKAPLNKKYDMAIEEITNILKGIKYVPDSVDYGKDYIQNPETILKRKRGDCDCMVAFAAYYFYQRGLSFEVDIGKLDWFSSEKHHPWIVFNKNDTAYIYDATSGKLIKKENKRKISYVPIEDQKVYEHVKTMVKDYKKRTGIRLPLKKYEFK